MLNRLKVVTIDGPSGVGKSTVSRKLAERLDFTYLDTGAMYRAVAYQCCQLGIDTDNIIAVRDLLEEIEIRLLPATTPGQDVRVYVDNREVGALVRTPEMSMLASKVSALAVVRQHLTLLQQQMGSAGQVVAEGRDTGTVVFPEAAWKFYLDANPEVRTKRRVDQLSEQGKKVDEKELLEQLIQRDRDDSQRKIAPLKAADDAVLIDSTALGAAGVVDKMMQHIQANPL